MNSLGANYNVVAALIKKKKISSCFSRSFTSIHASSLEDVLFYAVLVKKTVNGEISTKKIPKDLHKSTFNTQIQNM